MYPVRWGTYLNGFIFPTSLAWSLLGSLAMAGAEVNVVLVIIAAGCFPANYIEPAVGKPGFTTGDYTAFCF